MQGNRVAAVWFSKIRSSSVARGKGGGAWAPPIGLKSMQNTLFLALLRPIFALKTKIANPNGVWHETWSRTWYDMNQKNWVKTFLAKTFFSGVHLNLGFKTDSIWVKINENLGQDRLMLFPASKTALPQCKFLATRLIRRGYLTRNFYLFFH